MWNANNIKTTHTAFVSPKIFKDKIDVTEITFSEKEEVITEDSGTIVPLYPQYIPEGFELISQVETESIIKRIYENGTSVLSYSQTAKVATNLVINTENTDSEKICLSNQTEAMYTKNQNKHHLVFADKKYVFTITISEPYKKEDIIEIADSIKGSVDLNMNLHTIKIVLGAVVILKLKMESFMPKELILMDFLAMNTVFIIKNGPKSET